jgi:hypothetical protein
MTSIKIIVGSNYLTGIDSAKIMETTELILAGKGIEGPIPQLGVVKVANEK